MDELVAKQMDALLRILYKKESTKNWKTLYLEAGLQKSEAEHALSNILAEGYVSIKGRLFSVRSDIIITDSGRKYFMNTSYSEQLKLRKNFYKRNKTIINTIIGTLIFPIIVYSVSNWINKDNQKQVSNTTDQVNLSKIIAKNSAKTLVLQNTNHGNQQTQVVMGNQYNKYDNKRIKNVYKETKVTNLDSALKFLKAPRTIHQKGLDTNILIQILKPYSGTKIEMTHIAQVDESKDFCWELWNVFSSSGWIHTEKRPARLGGGAIEPIYYGVLILHKSDQFNQEVKAISKVLQTLHYDVKIYDEISEPNLSIQPDYVSLVIGLKGSN